MDPPAVTPAGNGKLTSQQHKLVHLYYEQGVSKEVMNAEQERLEAEQAQVERWQAAAANEIADVDQALSDALVLIDAHRPIPQRNTTERRLINLAIYVMLLVSDEGHVQAKPTAFYSQLVPPPGSWPEKPPRTAAAAKAQEPPPRRP